MYISYVDKTQEYLPHPSLINSNQEIKVSSETRFIC